MCRNEMRVRAATGTWKARTTAWNKAGTYRKRWGPAAAGSDLTRNRYVAFEYVPGITGRSGVCWGPLIGYDIGGMCAHCIRYSTGLQHICGASESSQGGGRPLEFHIGEKRERAGQTESKALPPACCAACCYCHCQLPAAANLAYSKFPTEPSSAPLGAPAPHRRCTGTGWQAGWWCSCQLGSRAVCCCCCSCSVLLRAVATATVTATVVSLLPVMMVMLLLLLL